MKKNYTKPSLLSETFVTENIMTGDELSTIANLWTISGDHFTGIQFNSAKGGNTLFKVKFNEFSL